MTESDSLDRLHDDRAAPVTFAYSPTSAERFLFLVIHDENGVQMIPFPLHESR